MHAGPGMEIPQLGNEVPGTGKENLQPTCIIDPNPLGRKDVDEMPRFLNRNLFYNILHLILKAWKEQKQWLFFRVTNPLHHECNCTLGVPRTEKIYTC